MAVADDQNKTQAVNDDAGDASAVSEGQSGNQVQTEISDTGLNNGLSGDASLQGFINQSGSDKSNDQINNTKTQKSDQIPEASDVPEASEAPEAPEKPESREQTTTHVTVSPESAPISIEATPAETSTHKEYGYEKIERLEEQAEQLQIERKEQKPEEAKPIVQEQAVEEKVEKQEAVKIPDNVLKNLRFPGYAIPEDIVKDHNLIKVNKGKGDANNTRTWLYILLDKLLKKHTK